MDNTTNVSAHTRLNNGTWMTFDEIVNDVEITLKQSEKKTIASMKKEDLIRLHSNLGMWIRNVYGLWNENHPLTSSWSAGNRVITKSATGLEYDDSPDHPDAVSFKIIEELWTRLSYLRP